MVSEKVMRQRTREIFQELEVTVDPKAIMSTMPVSQRQMVEIAKAVSYDSKIIVFPPSAGCTCRRYAARPESRPPACWTWAGNGW